MSDKVMLLGATSAIAQEVAVRLAARGARLWLVGRDPRKLATLCARLGDAVVGSEAADLLRFDDNPALVQRGIEALGGLDTALLAHGELGDQQATEREFAAARHILDANLTSAVSLLIPLANHFERQGRGHLAAITSVAGERGRPRNYTYGAAKGALSRYLEGLRSRLRAHGVRVHNLKLGPVPTPMSAGHRQNFLWGEKGRVADGIVCALRGRRHVTYLPRHWALVMAVVRLLPEVVFQRFAFLAGR